MAFFHNSLHVLVVCVITCCMFTRTACDRTVSTNGIYTKVLGQSGKITVGRTENPANDPKRITIDFDSIKEMSANNETVGQSGQDKHSFQTFASLSFAFSEVTDVQFQNISAKKFNFSSSISSVSAELVIDVYIFKESGNITIGDEVTAVVAGNVKFNIQISNWTFCGGSGGVQCRKGNTDEEGAFLDFVIEIKGKQSANKNSNETDRTTGELYNFGDDGSVMLSRKVQYDSSGSWVDLPGNYPSFENNGNKQVFVFRFARFASSVLYDPTLALSTDSADTDDGLDVGSVASVSLLLLLGSIIMQQLSLMLTKN